MKLDLKKEFKTLYNAPDKEPVIIDVPEMKYLMINGEGNPNSSQAFQEAVEALYGVSYSMKFMVKKAGLYIDYTVMPLQGLWWTDDMNNFSLEKKEDWKWTLMILQPEFIKYEMFVRAVEEIRSKKGLKALEKLRLESYNEGLSSQIMHIGPYSAEPPTIEKLHRYISEKGYAREGKHHEIYIGDPRKTVPEKLKTIIRQPVVFVRKC